MNKTAEIFVGLPWQVIETVKNAYGHPLRDVVVDTFRTEREAMQHMQHLEQQTGKYAWGNVPTSDFRVNYEKSAGPRHAGAGVSPEQLYRGIRNGLIKMGRDIAKKFGYNNVDLKYGKSELNGTVSGHPVRIYYEILRASNGETSGLPVLIVDGVKYARFMRPVEEKLSELIIDNTFGVAASELVKIAKSLVGMIDPQLLSDPRQDHLLGIAIRDAGLELVEMIQLGDGSEEYVAKQEKFARDAARVLGFKFHIKTSFREAVEDLIWETADAHM